MPLLPPKSLIHRVEAAERRGRWFPALALLGCIAVLVAGWMGLSGFLFANAAMGTFKDIQGRWVPDTSEMALSLPDPSETSYIYAADGTLLAELHNGRNSKPVAYEELPEHVVFALLAAEDRNFFEHDGVDYPSLASAMLDTLRGNMRGGSTITQQIAKNVFVGSEVTLERKAREALVAIELERRFPKERLIEFYLNSVYFGSGAYGVSAAAEEYFGTTPDQLTPAQAAALMVPIRNPSLYNPRRRPDLVTDRRNAIIDIMESEGWLTADEAAAARQEPLDVKEPQRFRGPADHVVAEVTRQLLHDSRFSMLGDTPDERKWAVFGCPADDVECEGGGGLHIWTVTNLELQQRANEILESWLPLPPPEENYQACLRLFPDDDPDFLRAYATEHSCAPTGALTMVDNRTGAVLVMASGLDFDFSQFNLALQARRNPGSSFKVFALVAALENGLTLGHIFDGASPMDIDCGFPCGADGSNIWTVRNSAGSAGEVTLDQATSSSINTVYAQLAVQVGVDKIVEVARRMGIRSPLREYPSLVLGTSEVTTLEMASAYSNFATNGLWAEPYLIAKITDSDGNVIYEHHPEPKQVIDQRVAAAARIPLERVPTDSGTAPRANIGRPQGGKTGTHQSYFDAWYVGFTPEYTAAVWVGYEAKQVPLENVTIKGETYRRVFGGTIPAPIWAEFMSEVTAGLPPSEFPAPFAPIDHLLEPAVEQVPLAVGLDVEQATELLEERGFVVSVEEVASVEDPGRVLAQSLEPYTEVPAGAEITLRVSNGETPTALFPNVVGMTVDQAKEALYGMGLELTVHIRTAETDQIEAWGRVTDQSPQAGTTVRYGDEVLLTEGVRPQPTTTTTSTTSTLPPPTTTTHPPTFPQPPGS